MQVQLALIRQNTFLDGISLRVLFPVGIFGIRVDGSDVLFARSQEVEYEFGGMTVFTGCAAYVPVVRTFCLTGNSDVTSRLSFQIAAVVPIHSHIFDELDGNEGILVASRIADRVGITRSVIVNALRKFESAGVIESRSSGMKGTYIKVLNDAVFEELDNLKAKND